MNKTINLGKKVDSGMVPLSPKAAKNKTSYPTIYISDIKGELPEGEFTFTGKAVVTRKTEDMKTDKCSYDIELMSITPDGPSEDDDLETTMKRKVKEKMDVEDGEEYD